MTILVTGNRGYIGSILTELLLNTGHEVVGYDTCYYDDCFLTSAVPPTRQIKKDMRDISGEDLRGIDAVIHLAALSNDPLGEFDAGLTEEINFKATAKLASLAKVAGVKRFVYASSQSMYGVADTAKEVEEDDGGENGVTMYAKTKWSSELELKKMCSPEFVVVCLRPSTVFGASPNLRCDIIFNNFVASAYTTGKIEIKSDGTPWRPVVHVRDVSGAFIAALTAPAELVQCQSFNVGIPNGNFTVKDLALAAQACVQGSELVFTGELGRDERTYRVSFAKILGVLHDYYHPEWDLSRGGKELVDFFRKVGFTEEQFEGRICNRLQQIKYLIDGGRLDQNFKWIK